MNPIRRIIFISLLVATATTPGHAALTDSSEIGIDLLEQIQLGSDTNSTDAALLRDIFGEIGLPLLPGDLLGPNRDLADTDSDLPAYSSSPSPRLGFNNEIDTLARQMGRSLADDELLLLAQWRREVLPTAGLAAIVVAGLHSSSMPVIIPPLSYLRAAGAHPAESSLNQPAPATVINDANQLPATPIPPTFILTGSGLVGIFLLRKRR